MRRWATWDTLKHSKVSRWFIKKYAKRFNIDKVWLCCRKKAPMSGGPWASIKSANYRRSSFVVRHLAWTESRTRRVFIVSSPIAQWIDILVSARLQELSIFINVHSRPFAVFPWFIFNRKWTGIHLNSVIMSSAQLGLNPDLDEFLLSIRELESKKREYFTWVF